MEFLTRHEEHGSFLFRKILDLTALYWDFVGRLR